MMEAQAESSRRRAAWWLGTLVIGACLLGTSQLKSQSATPPGGSAPLSINVPGASKAADDQGDSASDAPRATLHVYTNLMQVPVLVLNSDRERMKPVPESKFRIRLDSGPLFKPTHVRLEGDDPLELAILIDESRPEDELLPGIGAAVASLSSGSLRAWDHVSIYAMDCGVIRTAYDQPPDSGKLHEAIDRALAGWSERRHHRRPPKCRSSVQLFDAMAYVTDDLMKLSGRRAMLVLTDGMDRGSRINWNRLARFEQLTSTAVFGLQSRQQMEDASTGRFNYRQYPIAAGIDRSTVRAEDQFDIICQTSGGVQLTLSGAGLNKGLVRFIQMLRERYIVEYPRSNTATAGVHDLFVTIGDAYAYVRPAGISVPLVDKKLLENPLTLPSQVDAPVEGPRRVLGDGASTPSAPRTNNAPAASPQLP